MVFESSMTGRKISIEGNKIQNAERVTYLGSNIMHDLDCKEEI